MKLLIRLLCGILITVILLSFCDSWLFGNSEYDWLENLNEPLHEEDEFDWNGEIRAKRGERKYFAENEEPLVHNQRCDACRIIGNRVHIGFELAESKLGIKTHSFDEYEELADEDVEEVSRQVCSKSTFRYVLPIHLRGIDRLAASELETFQFTNLPQNTDQKSEISWPRRLRNHCKHMIKNLQGRELYEMWLKTSVGETHTSGKGFVNFFCFGEGIFSDCVERDRVINLDGKITWPAGDDLEEDEIDEYEEDEWEFNMDLMDQLSTSPSSANSLKSFWQ